MLHKRKTYHLVILDVGVSPNTYLFTTSGRTNEITARMSPSCIISCICVHDLWKVRKRKFDVTRRVNHLQGYYNCIVFPWYNYTFEWGTFHGGNYKSQ